MPRLRRCLCIAFLAAAAAGPEILAAADRVELGAGPARVTLSASHLPVGPQVFLVLRDLRAAAQPGVVYDIYLGLPAAAAVPGAADPRYVGTFNFFAATSPAGTGPTLSYDVTENLRRLQAQGRLQAGITVTIAPEGTPAAPARARIGRIELVAQ